jgi:hypothetical protein
MINNLFSQLPAQPPEQEQFLTLLQQPYMDSSRFASIPLFWF